MNTKYDACVIGLGYIGLPTAAIMADSGLSVLGIDINSAAVNSINAGKAHIVEPGLGELLQRSVRSGALRASVDLEPADAYIIAVPTPLRLDSTGKKRPDLSYVEAVVDKLAPQIVAGNVIILESTSPVGATLAMRDQLRHLRPDLVWPSDVSDQPDVAIAYCPERVLPGNAITELVTNDRLIGGITQKCAERAQQLYKKFVSGGDCVLTDAKTAEMAKLVENASRDVQIAFANELSLMCDQLGVDVWELIALANRHPRVSILEPGPGVGGHCIAVDPWFLIDACESEAKLTAMARNINDGKPNWVVNKVLSLTKEVLEESNNLQKPVVACFGLAFKPNIDDFRESPSIQIVKALSTRSDLTLLVVEPYLKENILPNTRLVSYEEAMKKANIAVMLVNHSEFYNQPLRQGIKILDLKGVWPINEAPI